MIQILDFERIGTAWRWGPLAIHFPLTELRARVCSKRSSLLVSEEAPGFLIDYFEASAWREEEHVLFILTW